MKVEQVSDHIWMAKPWIPIRVWLVVDNDGVTLVDTGLPFMAAGILQAVKRLDAGPLQRILLTHGHGDHTGGMKRILDSQTVPVFAHRLELPYLEGALPYPRRKKAEQGAPKGLVRPLAEDGQGGLQMVAGLQPYHTPGHSPGHVVYFHVHDLVLLAGDQFMSRKGQVQPPSARFTADMEQAMRSGEVLSRLKPDRLEITHGGPVLRVRP
jgi:glyoxylase-like metal-dependent hydrolase (beta-lactamase superfamily II)